MRNCKAQRTLLISIVLATILSPRLWADGKTFINALIPCHRPVEKSASRPTPAPSFIDSLIQRLENPSDPLETAKLVKSRLADPTTPSYEALAISDLIYLYARGGNQASRDFANLIQAQVDNLVHDPKEQDLRDIRFDPQSLTFKVAVFLAHARGTPTESFRFRSPEIAAFRVAMEQEFFAADRTTRKEVLRMLAKAVDGCCASGTHTILSSVAMAELREIVMKARSVVPYPTELILLLQANERKSQAWTSESEKIQAEIKKHNYDEANQRRLREYLGPRPPSQREVYDAWVKENSPEHQRWRQKLEENPAINETLRMIDLFFPFSVDGAWQASSPYVYSAPGHENIP